jgi:hypothetical protein
MDDFLKYVTNLDPAFCSRIRGAPRDEIARYQSLVHHEVPQEYLNFLQIMGHNDDNIVGKRAVTTNLADVISFYEEDVASGEEAAPDDCIFIGVGGAATEHLALEVSGLRRVLEASEGKKYKLWAGSLENLLYMSACMRYRHRFFRNSAAYTSLTTGPSLEKIRAELQRRGLVLQWFSDEVSLCAEVPGTLVIANQYEGHGIFLRTATDGDAHNMDLIANRISQVVGVALKEQVSERVSNTERSQPPR